MDGGRVVALWRMLARDRYFSWVELLVVPKRPAAVLRHATSLLIRAVG